MARSLERKWLYRPSYVSKQFMNFKNVIYHAKGAQGRFIYHVVYTLLNFLLFYICAILGTKIISCKSDKKTMSPTISVTTLTPNYRRFLSLQLLIPSIVTRATDILVIARVHKVRFAKAQRFSSPETLIIEIENAAENSIHASCERTIMELTDEHCIERRFVPFWRWNVKAR